MISRAKIIDILDGDDLYRRIHPNFQKDNGEISSGAFKHRKPLSVDIARLTTPKKSLSSYANHWLSSIISRLVRNLGLEAYHRPVHSNYAHAEIEGKITPSKAKQLAKSAKLVLK